MFEGVGAGIEESDTRAWTDPFTGLPLPPRTHRGLLPDQEADGCSADAAADADAGPAVTGSGADRADRLPAVHPLVAGLQVAVAALARAQTEGTMAAGSLVDTAALLRAAESVAGLALVELAAVDRTKTYLGVGRASAAGWLGATLTIAEASARAKVTLARRLTEDLAPIGALLIDGGTTVAHCAAMTAGLRGIRPEVVAESAPALITLARTLDPPCLHRELRERALAVSPELAAEQEKRQRQRTGLTASELPDGCVSLHGLLAPEGGQVLLAALDAIIHGDRRARQADGVPDDRDAPTRRADALTTLAAHALGCDGLLPQQAGTRPTIHVVVAAQTLLDPTPGSRPATFAASNALLTRHHLLRLSCDADISRVALDPHGNVIDLGRTTRTVTTSQWQALIARDQGCIIKGCRRRHTECEAHHLWHWALGGPSDLTNYALVCHLHHHQLHEGHKTLPTRDDRWLTPTGYHDPDPPLF